jgi:diguanylate cyclase (GGDEF)-like protein
VARLAATGMRRPGDLAARYGGEELVLLMPETDAGEAQSVVEGIREELARLAIPHETSSVAPVLTVSVGGATLAPGAREQSAELFEAADTHLYRAKQGGRNRIIWRTPAG